VREQLAHQLSDLGRGQADENVARLDIAAGRDPTLCRDLRTPLDSGGRRRRDAKPSKAGQESGLEGAHGSVPPQRSRRALGAQIAPNGDVAASGDTTVGRDLGWSAQPPCEESTDDSGRYATADQGPLSGPTHEISRLNLDGLTG
jgi:hypothetical protein